MRWKSLTVSICALLLLAYLFIFGITFYAASPGMLISHVVKYPRLPLAPPRVLVEHLVICCKNLGPKGGDEYGLIPMLVNVGVVESDREDLRNVAKKLISRLVNDRELSVNRISPKSGTTSLHVAILTYQPWAIELLLELGADPCIRIDNSNPRIDEKNALELALYLVGSNLPAPDKDVEMRVTAGRKKLEDTIPLLNVASMNCN